MAKLDKTLEAMTQPELLGLVKAMLKVQPELAALVQSGKSPQQDALVRQARRDLSRGYSLDTWIEKARRYHKAGKSDLAVQLFQAVLEETLPDVLELDQEGEMVESLSEAVSGLLDCWKSGNQERILRILFEVLHWDIEAGGLGLSEEIPPFLSELESSEASLFLTWVEQAVAELKSGPNWQREQWGQMARRLMESEDECLEFLQSNGMDESRFRVMLDRGDFTTAFSIATAADSSRKFGFANRLREAGQLVLARRLVCDGLDHWAGWNWLAESYASTGESRLALDFYLRCWSARQDLSTFTMISRLAKKLKLWKELGPRLVQEVPPGWPRVEILIDQKAFSQAWDLADRLPGGDHIVRELASQSASQFPLRAAQELLNMAKRRVEQGRTRAAYREACSWVKQGLSYLGPGLFHERPRLLEPWAVLHARLPALREEWKAQGLRL